MKNSKYAILMLSIFILALCPIQVTAQGAWERLPSYDAITIGLSYSSYSNNIPQKIDGKSLGEISKTLIIPSLAFQTDITEGYSRYQPSVALVGDLIYAGASDETNYSLITGGLIGNYDRGINFITEPRMRVGAGGTVEDYIMTTETPDQGYHMGLGPNVKCDYLLTESWYARVMVKYVFSIYYFVGNSGTLTKEIRENAKNPHFFTFDVQAIAIWGLNVRLEYWKTISREDSNLKLSRFWLHLAFAF